jgi:DNA-binding response OmpR family regulator
VDDDDTIRHINARALALSGYHVDAAPDGAAAWDTLQRADYDLLITDNNMPHVSGVELLQKLHAAHIALPVILSTGMLPKAELTQHPWLQPAALLIKPYSFRELLGTVRNVLRVTVQEDDKGLHINQHSRPLDGGPEKLLSIPG